MEYSFASFIENYLKTKYGDDAEQLFSMSYILQYIVHKTKSADKGAKSRGSFANLYAVYVIVEDYLNHGFDQHDDYVNYEGVQFSALLKRQ